jgi:hypothetical protein
MLQPLLSPTPSVQPLSVYVQTSRLMHLILYLDNHSVESFNPNVSSLILITTVLAVRCLANYDGCFSGAVPVVTELGGTVKQLSLG